MKKVACLGIVMLFCQTAFARSLVLPCQPTKKGYCIQAATFNHARDALRYEDILRSHTPYPVHTIYQKGHYRVILGPIPGKKQAERASQKLRIKWPNPSSLHWFLTIGGGMAFPSFGHTNFSVPNNSGFPSPYNQDAYTVHQNPQPLFTLGLGRRWEKSDRWLPAYSLGLYYQHFFATNIGNQITQYTAPGFTNYQYNWDLSSDILLLGGKLNIIRLQRLLPFVSASLGCALNKSSGYSESALPGLTDTRVSPSYQERTMAQFVYSVGAGLDLQLTKAFLLSAEYQFQNGGNNALGHGAGTWSNESLALGSNRANILLFSLTYLFQ